MAERKRQANQTGGRPVRRNVMMTDAEFAEVSIAAERAGRTVPRFLVESSISRVRGISPDEVHEAITGLFGVQHQLAKIGNNVNQIARHANASGGEILREELQEELRQLRKALRSVDEVLELVSLEVGRG